ncbi:GTP pyrophosphokinase [Leptospira terpstrae]|uniref:GTP pyrophosphokinase n=1 Tax=Leptospira terpstrae TaxID=293075 RepID=UPI003CFC417B
MTEKESKKILKEYDTNLENFERLQEEVNFELENFSKNSGSNVHSILSRIKTRKSLEEKITRNKAFIENQTLNDYIDILGFRIVVLFLTDIPKAKAKIEEIFQIETIDNKGTEIDTFGYQSMHFIAKLPPHNSGKRYNEIKHLKFEIQLRTICMDAWANISHHISYKTPDSLPEKLRKDFYGLSGLFYVADKHFELFYKSSIESLKNALSNVTNAEELNFDSLNAYLVNNFQDRPTPTNENSLSGLISEFKAVNINTINEVHEIVKKAEPIFKEHEMKHPPAEMNKYYAEGVVRTSLYIIHPKLTDNFHETLRKRFYDYNKRIGKHV